MTNKRLRDKTDIYYISEILHNILKSGFVMINVLKARPNFLVMDATSLKSQKFITRKEDLIIV